MILFKSDVKKTTIVTRKKFILILILIPIPILIPILIPRILVALLFPQTLLSSQQN